MIFSSRSPSSVVQSNEYRHPIYCHVLRIVCIKYSASDKHTGIFHWPLQLLMNNQLVQRLSLLASVDLCLNSTLSLEYHIFQFFCRETKFLYSLSRAVCSYSIAYTGGDCSCYNSKICTMQLFNGYCVQMFSDYNLQDHGNKIIFCNYLKYHL